MQPRPRAPQRGAVSGARGGDLGGRRGWHGICKTESGMAKRPTGRGGLRVLVVDESAERAEILRDGLRRAGHEVTASLSSPLALLKTIEELQPEVIVIDTDSPSRDVLEHLVMVSRHTPRPVVMFATDGAPEKIREAVRAGASAYVVDGLDPARVKTIVDVAVAYFEDFQKLREQLAQANLKLSERKLVERAKSGRMKTRGIEEEAADSLLRKLP